MPDYRALTDILRKQKVEMTQKKLKKYTRPGFFDTDDKGWVVPPEGWSFDMEYGADLPPLQIPDGLGGFVKGYDGTERRSRHPNGVFGPVAWGENFYRFLDVHPPYIDPYCSLSGAYMDKLEWHGWGGWRPEPEFNPPELQQLRELHRKYDLISGLGGSHHFHHDVKNIGFVLGFGGILEKIRHYKAQYKDDTEKYEFLLGEELTLLGIQQWIKHNAEEAERVAALQTDPELKQNLEEQAAMSYKLMTEPPATFREACQFLTYFLIQSSMFNGSGAGGALEDLLTDFYENDRKAGRITEDEATFHLACLFLKDTQYYEIGGCWPDGSDRTNAISYMAIEAAHWLKIPTALCLRIHDGIDRKFVRKSVEYLFEDKCANPSYIGDRIMVEGFMKNGYSAEIARTRAKVGCNWCALPGTEYTLNDVVKINMGKVFELAWNELKTLPRPSTEKLWHLFDKHLDIAIDVIKHTVDQQYKFYRYMRPELALDFMCHGPIEKALDASGGGVENYNFCIDFVALGTVADSFASVERAIDDEAAANWEELFEAIETDFADAEDLRLYLRQTPKYGFGETRADEYAVAIKDRLVYHTKKSKSPMGFNMIPGLFSWANTIGMGRAVQATPNGRKAGTPVTHGANPEPGFRESGALTAMGIAVASVQPAWGNTAPIQLEIDPALTNGTEGIENICAWLMTYCCDLGGSLVNINILDKAKLLDAYEHPERYPDLVVRITGFSVFFSTLTQDFRKLVVERVIQN
ncbi:MAG: pyruvate formate lyase family protein [Oscillospiraceae bacterium]|jgi:formate C-acetyltransferase|nr:pyruvate formate lyase family protein [Oscillospiraceae bacterium]